jgi:hypothetical protein
MVTAGEAQCLCRLALRIEHKARKRLALIVDGDGTSGRQAVCAAYGDEDRRLGMSVDVTGVYQERGLRGLLPDRGRGQRWHCKSDTYRRNP